MSIKTDVKLVNINIDGKELQVQEGSTVLEAAMEAGIEIPTLCYLKNATVDGSCRMCTVDIQGVRKSGLKTACSTFVAEGMEIYTNTEKVRDARKFVLDLILSAHEKDCENCPKSGLCDLEKYCDEYGLEESSMIHKCVEEEKLPDNTNPFFNYDPNKCIMCRKCVRTCDQLQGRHVLSITERGYESEISTSYKMPWEFTECEHCGNCVSNCSTGALTSKDIVKFHNREKEIKKVLTTCPHCATGCQYYLLVEDGEIVGVEPSNGPSNRNLLCVKGKYASYKFVRSGDRITTPLIKRDGEFVKASWEEALTYVTDRFKEIQKNHGYDSIAGFSCSRAPNEDNYLFQKMMRTAFKTNNVDNCARVCHSASVTGLAATLGSGAMTNPIRDITHDVDAILLVGSNPTEAHPVTGTQIRKAIREEGTKLIVVDPRKIDLVDQATIHLQIKPGTNVAFANGMINCFIEEGLIDEKFIEEKTEGWEKLKEIVKDYTPEKVAEICEIDAEDLREAARIYGSAKKAPIIYCLGVTEHSSGTEGVMSLSNVAMSVGKIGKEGCGINPLRGQNNVQGACDMGAMPTDFPGYQKVAAPGIIEKFEEAWGTELSRTTGLKSTEALPAALDGKIKGLYIFGEDPLVSDPDTNHTRKCLEALDFFVIQELFMTETAELADVILPGVSYAEKEGTFTNTERRVQRVRKAVEPRGEARLDTDIFYDIMNLMGYSCERKNAEEIMDEISSVTPSFRGINYRRLDRGETLQWPCTDENSPGTYIMHKDGNFARGLGYFYPAQYRESQELPCDDYPLLLVTGRMLYHYNAGAMTHRTEGIMEVAGESYIEINKENADRLGIKDGEKVKVSSRRGEIETKAVVGDKVSEDEVFMTFHFPDGNANYVTNGALDNFARIPEYKVCAVKVSKIQ